MTRGRAIGDAKCETRTLSVRETRESIAWARLAPQRVRSSPWRLARSFEYSRIKDPSTVKCRAWIRVALVSGPCRIHLVAQIRILWSGVPVDGYIVATHRHVGQPVASPRSSRGGLRLRSPLERGVRYSGGDLYTTLRHRGLPYLFLPHRPLTARPTSWTPNSSMVLLALLDERPLYHSRNLQS